MTRALFAMPHCNGSTTSALLPFCRHAQNVWLVRNGVSLLLDDYTGLGGYLAWIHHDLRAHIRL